MVNAVYCRIVSGHMNYALWAVVVTQLVERLLETAEVHVRIQSSANYVLPKYFQMY